MEDLRFNIGRKLSMVTYKLIVQIKPAVSGRFAPETFRSRKFRSKQVILFLKDLKNN